MRYVYFYLVGLCESNVSPGRVWLTEPGPIREELPESRSRSVDRLGPFVLVKPSTTQYLRGRVVILWLTARLKEERVLDLFRKGHYVLRNDMNQFRIDAASVVLPRKVRGQLYY